MHNARRTTHDARRTTHNAQRTTNIEQPTAKIRQAGIRHRTKNFRPNFEFQLILTTIVRNQILHVKILKIYILRIV